MKKLLPLLSLALLVAMTFVISCSKDDPKPDTCDGTLAVVVDSKTNLTTCTANDGSITVSATGGKAPYKYSLNGGTKQASATFSDLSAGTYSVTVFDDKDCEDTEIGIAITSPSNLDFASVTPTNDTDCTGNNGSIVVSGTGGTGTYEYALNTGTFGASGTFNGLAPGTYTVKVRDDLDCIFSESVTVSQSTTISFSGRIKPIIDSNCATTSSCHASGASGRPVLTTYSVIKDNASKIKSLTQSGEMPKNGSLTTQEKADIACWVDGGAPNN
jgi:uncharacterized protein (DUF2141 family)